MSKPLSIYTYPTPSFLVLSLSVSIILANISVG